MKYLPIAIFCSIIIITGCKKDPVTTSVMQEANKMEPDYELAWADEFNYTGLPDLAYWNYEVGYVRNNEKQYYQPARLENSRVENGKLIITALNDSFENHPITSASITTKGKKDFRYGKMEVSAKMPKGKGAWPAIWTLGINHDTIGWPRCGEIDILEWLGIVPNFVWGSIHMPNAQGEHRTRITGHPVLNASTLSNDFHTYTIEWDSTKIMYYYDNVKYATYFASKLTKFEWEPFTRSHYLLLNLAMGGSSGRVIDKTKFPFVYEIDYVRYYRKVE